MGTENFKHAVERLQERLGSVSLPVMLRLMQSEFGPEELGYVNPPAHAIVLSVDEKSQIRVLDRTQCLDDILQASLRSAVALKP